MNHYELIAVLFSVQVSNIIVYCRRPLSCIGVA